MALGFEFTNEAGTARNLHDGTTHWVRQFSEYGQPDLLVDLQERHGRPGATLRAATLPPRRVTLEVACRGATVAAHESTTEALLKHLAGTYGRNNPRFGVLKHTKESGAIRSLRCIGAAGLRLDTRDRWSPMGSVVRATFLADHPNWYDPAEKSANATIGSGAGLTYPITYPGTYGISAQAGSATLTNSGSAETRSLLWSVPGPSTAPAIWSATVERLLALPTLTVPTGLTLRVRMGWRPDGIAEHRAYLDDGQGTETSVIGHLSAASRFFWLEPGANLVEVSQSNVAATVHSLKWYDEYLSA